MSVTKKIFKTLFPVPVTNMVSDAFFGWGWGQLDVKANGK